MIGSLCLRHRRPVFEAAATPQALRQPAAIPVVPADATGTGPARATKTPEVQGRQAGGRSAAATAPPEGPLPETRAKPHVPRISANLRPTPPPIPLPQGGGESFGFDLMPGGNRGRLKNGAAGGGYFTAPRCDARTGAGGSCRQPAMPNSRCRMHGGLSTGARIEAGRERHRSIQTKHGGYGRDSLARFRRVHAFVVESKRFMAEHRGTSAVAAAVPVAAGGRSVQGASRAGRPRAMADGDPSA
jgi:hypothetical protein